MNKKSENLENCRLLGISGSREAKLMAQLDVANKTIARLTRDCKNLRAVLGHPQKYIAKLERDLGG